MQAITEANGLEKTASGEIAPVWWQKNKIADLITYCLNDATVEAQILEKLIKGKLIDPNTGEKLKIDKEQLSFDLFYA